MLYARRALSMSWTRGRRELCFSGRLPLEQGAAFEQAIWQIATARRAIDKQSGTDLDWQTSAADALVTLAHNGTGHGESGVRRSPTTLIVHIGDDQPPVLEGAGPISPETAERLTCDARRLTIKPHGSDLCTRASGAARPTRSSVRCTAARRTASTPAAAPPASSRRTT